MRIQDMGENIEWKPELFRDLTPEEQEDAKVLLRDAFTADDLQRFTEIEEGTPFEQLLAEMEEVIQKPKQGGE